MGGNTSKKVSFGLDENEKVTVIEGVKVDITSRFDSFVCNSETKSKLCYEA